MLGFEGGASTRGKLEMRWNGASGFFGFDLRGVVGGGE